MQPLAGQSNNNADVDECAREVLLVVPAVMRVIRAEMRRHRPAGLSVPQFRAMGFIYRQTHASLSEVAERLSVALPTASRTMDGLVKRGLVDREVSQNDRRCSVLTLSNEGITVYDSAKRHAEEHLAKSLQSLSASEREEVTRSMQMLRHIVMETD